jgi:hypothetical protein
LLPKDPIGVYLPDFESTFRWGARNLTPNERPSAKPHISQNNQQLALEHVADTALQNVVRSSRQIKTVAIPNQPRNKIAPSGGRR